ncbi:hypothetical protein [Streptomyces sp. NPDC054804]
MVPYVYDFAEGGREMAGLLGGKGANLAEMTRPTASGGAVRRSVVRYDRHRRGRVAQYRVGDRTDARAQRGPADPAADDPPGRRCPRQAGP